MKIGRRVKQALKDAGAVLKRQKKHRVYELPNGKNVVVASTPSDCRAENNTIRDLNKTLGVKGNTNKSTPPKVERRAKPGRREPDWSLPVNTLAAALKDSGVVNEQFYQDRIAALERDSAEYFKRWWVLKEQYQEIETQFFRLRDSRWVRLGKWLRLVR